MIYIYVYHATWLVCGALGSHGQRQWRNTTCLCGHVLLRAQNYDLVRLLATRLAVVEVYEVMLCHMISYDAM